MGCLTENELMLFLNGQQSDTLQSRVAQHIDHCESCHELLSALGSCSDHSISAVEAEHERTSTQITKPLRRGDSVGRYIVLAMLGAGGMGVVYSAYDPQLDRKVAIKILRGEVAHGGSARLQREAQALARLSHPNVIALFDIGEHCGQVYLAMEFVEGQTLTEWRTERTRSVDEILAIVLQAGRGLAAAHSAGIIHRDFKPSNILTTKDGEVRVADFGLALRSDSTDVEYRALPKNLLSCAGDDLSLTRTGSMLGTDQAFSLFRRDRLSGSARYLIQDRQCWDEACDIDYELCDMSG